VSIQHTESQAAEEFDATLWMALADSWWDLGKKMAPFVGDTLTAGQREGQLRAWVKAVHDDADDEVKAAVTPHALAAFVRTALNLLERKYSGELIAEDVQRLIEHARYRISDDGRLLRFGETPEAFWAWEYVYLFEDLKYDEPGWTAAVARCETCKAFFVKARKDQRFHSDACRKRAANQRFYKTRGKSKKRH
jgi:hypothetical protein